MTVWILVAFYDTTNLKSGVWKISRVVGILCHFLSVSPHGGVGTLGGGDGNESLIIPVALPRVTRQLGTMGPSLTCIIIMSEGKHTSVQ